MIYAKAEHQNLTGSIKDRLALDILLQGYQRGTLRPGDLIAAATSGNTGISFSAIGSALGHPVRIFMPDWMSQERKALIRSLGAEIVLVSREQGGFLGSIRMTENLARKEKQIFLPRQFLRGYDARKRSCRTCCVPEECQECDCPVQPG